MNLSAPKRESRASAFTLIELLIILGIIAVLIGILFPVITRARDSANTVKCMSNLRQICAAANTYTLEYKGYMMPAATNNDGWWPSILINGKFLAGPTTTDAERQAGAGPKSDGSLFNCPSGQIDLFPPSLVNNSTVPASRTDLYGAMAYREQSKRTTEWVDFWYGINADEESSMTTGAPVRRIQQFPRDQYIRSEVIRRSSEMVFMFDGLLYHLQNNGNRLNARHGKNTQTNVAFFDGHVTTYLTADLPGGMGNVPGSVFQPANLIKNYKAGDPIWLLEQQ